MFNPTVKLELAFAHFVVNLVDGHFETMCDYGGLMIMREAVWLQQRVIPGKLAGRATDRVELIFSLLDAVNKKALVSALEPVLNAKDSGIKAMFGVGYLGEMARVLRVVASRLPNGIAWTASAELLTKHLRRQLSDYLAHLDYQRSKVELPTIQERAEEVYERLFYQEMP